MLKILYIPLMIIIILFPSYIYGGEMAGIMDGWIAPLNEVQLGGKIFNPRICPADTSWVSFEVHSEDEIQLYVYNAAADDLREVMSRSGDGDSGIRNYDLAWCPRKISKDKIWAALVSNSSGSTELYLYDALSQSHYLLSSSEAVLDSGREREPDWSPDGHCLTYTSDASGNDDIYIICNMDELINNPDNIAALASPKAVLSTKADEYGAVWDPVIGSGYFAYHHKHDNTSAEIRIYDLRRSRSYTLAGGEAGMRRFTPSWEPGGKLLAYFQLDPAPEETTEIYGLALAEIIPRQDSLAFNNLKGGTALTQTEITKVAKNNSIYRGPAWSPDGRHLLISSYQPSTDNPFRVIDPSQWREGRGKPYWMSRFDDNLFGFPLDVTIVDRTMAFTFQKDQNRYLCLGQLEPRTYYGQRVISRRVEPDRLDWWQEYSSGRKVSAFTKIGNFLWKPIIGPDIGINKGIVPTALLGFLVVSVLTDGGDDSSPGRDWRPPEFPGAVGFSIKF